MFFIHKSVVCKNMMEFSNQLPNFDISIFDDEQNEGIDGPGGYYHDMGYMMCRCEGCGCKQFTLG